MGNITIIRNEKLWLEQSAVDSLTATADMRGITNVVGLPDLHPGKMPVGAVWASESVIHPLLIGNDIGCGMSLFDTGIHIRKYDRDRWAQKLENIEQLRNIKTEKPEACPFSDIGTLGGGNHFAEFQQIEKIYDSIAADELNLQKSSVYLLVHSGSRNYGEEIVRRFMSVDGYNTDSADADEYMELHDNAVAWAKINRSEAAAKLIKQIGFSGAGMPVIDCAHNYLEKRGESWLHRKGAVSTENGQIVIAGSRGSLSYIVKPLPDAKSLFSVSHGAGRKWARGLCKGRIENKYNKKDMYITELKSRVVVNDAFLLYEEAPEAYKNITQVIDCLVAAGLITITATMKPLVTFKDR